MRVSEMMMLPVTVSPCVVDEVSKTHPHLMPSNNTHIYSINIHYSHSRRNVITRLSSNLRWDHPQMRAFSYACSLLVTWQRWWLHHLIHHTPKPHAACMAVCLIEQELLPLEVLHCMNRNFQPFWLLGPWPSPDDLHIQTWPGAR